MENQNIKSDNDIDKKFLTRGCSQAPQLYQDNKNIFVGRCCKLNAHDWLQNVQLPEDHSLFNCVEVRFKNCRKDFFRIHGDMKFTTGDIVAVEATPGHDIGIVSLTGEIVKLQMLKKGVDPYSPQVKRIYRKARLADIEKWVNTVDLENEATLKSRKMAWDLNLDMKINDVEYQGDETKAVFYYTADERVDFRQLIKVLADHFKVRIEMRQIGVRQEAARLGGIGSCGRELCCSSWLSDFTSVSTSKARTQLLPMNPQKLAGQCGKLKCCLNFENDVYLDALKEFPDNSI
ncbi:MAG TPA: regulatory iron-sulfur-containing complex subunit RicT, partial [Bacteroidales bacterium]|nr:regulatory iron-sulfur-containing complex subunit RicT [Bacteroidales bacterium]